MMKLLKHPFIAELKRHVASQNATLGPIVLSLSELINKISPEHVLQEARVREKQRKLSEVTDMIHAAHVFHRCVRDQPLTTTVNDKDSGTSSSSSSSSSSSCDTLGIAKRLHQDNIMSLLVGDYLLAQSSVDMADLRYPRTVGLIAIGLENYTRGEFLKMQLLEENNNGIVKKNICDEIEHYAELTCGSLLSNACLSAALLAGYPERIEQKENSRHHEDGDVNFISNIVYLFGFHTGSAHRLIEILNSEADKVILDRIDVGQFKKSIGNHLEKSKKLLLDLPDGEKRIHLIEILNKMDVQSINLNR